jgi:hypothetical protein
LGFGLEAITQTLMHFGLNASDNPGRLQRWQLGEVHVDIVPRGADNQAKVAGQLNRDGNILEPSQTEINDATQAHQSRRFARAQQIFE